MNIANLICCDNVANVLTMLPSTNALACREALLRVCTYALVNKTKCCGLESKKYHIVSNFEEHTCSFHAFHT